MIAVDTNILVYADREDSPFHEAAFQRVKELAGDPGHSVAFAWHGLPASGQTILLRERSKRE